MREKTNPSNCILFHSFLRFFCSLALVKIRKISSYSNTALITTNDQFKKAFEHLTKRNRNSALNIKDTKTVIQPIGYNSTYDSVKNF